MDANYRATFMIELLFQDLESTWKIQIIKTGVIMLQKLIVRANWLIYYFQKNWLQNLRLVEQINLKLWYHDRYLIFSYLIHMNYLTKYDP